MPYHRKKWIPDLVIKEKIIWFLTKNCRVSILKIAKELEIDEKEVENYLELIKKDYYFTIRRKDYFYKYMLTNIEEFCDELGLDKKVLKTKFRKIKD